MVMPPLFPCLRRLGKPWWGITAAPCMTEKTINLRGLKCPLPALRARKALAGLKSGDLLVAECTDPLTAIDIPNLVNQTGDKLESNSREGDLLVFRIRKK
jgi:tRNA 2-thiouridine synthesizing protein A